MPMALTGAGPVSVGGAIEFMLLKRPKFDARSTIPRKPRMWSQVVMAMA